MSLDLDVLHTIHCSHSYKDKYLLQHNLNMVSNINNCLCKIKNKYILETLYRYIALKAAEGVLIFYMPQFCFVIQDC